MSAAGWIAVGLLGGAAAAARFLIDAWLNLGLSLIAGFAAIVLGHWLGTAL